LECEIEFEREFQILEFGIWNLESVFLTEGNGGKGGGVRVFSARKKNAKNARRALSEWREQRMQRTRAREAQRA
jgi:hypothetical protein